MNRERASDEGFGDAGILNEFLIVNGASSSWHIWIYLIICVLINSFPVRSILCHCFSPFLAASTFLGGQLKLKQRFSMNPRYVQKQFFSAPINFMTNAHLMTLVGKIFVSTTWMKQFQGCTLKQQSMWSIHYFVLFCIA